VKIRTALPDEKNLRRQHCQPAHKDNAVHMHDEWKRRLVLCNMLHDFRHEPAQYTEPEQRRIGEEEIAIPFVIRRERRPALRSEPRRSFHCHR